MVDSDGTADQSHKITTVVRDGQSVDVAASQSTGLTSGRLALFSSSTTSVSTLNFSDMKWQVLVSFAYLSDDERVLYSDASFETVITCWDTQETQYSSSSMGTIDISLPFAHPTAAIFVVKKAKRRPKSKKMRGGVTRKLLTRRKVSDLTREIGLGHGGSLNTRIKEFVRPALTNQSIHAAVQDYLNGGARKRRIVEKYGEISNWDTSSVTYMQSLFYEGGSFNQPLNKWNVSNVTNMRDMFAYCSFNQPLNNWDVSNVNTMERMFWTATYFNQPLNNWDVSYVEDMAWMFMGSLSFNQPLNNWDVSNVTNMWYMFLNATSFNLKYLTLAVALSRVAAEGPCVDEPCAFSMTRLCRAKEDQYAPVTRAISEEDLVAPEDDVERGPTLEDKRRMLD